MTNNIRYIVISPVRDEEAHIGKTIESMACQSLLPIQWVIVDDGSSDGTRPILDEAAARYPWIQVIHRENRGFRKSGGGVIEAFYEGYAQITEDWNFLVKLDGDLSFGKNYFEQCLDRFVSEPGLGIGGGYVCIEKDGRWVDDSPGDPPFHVRGATKIYRKACWDQVAPLITAPGWDTIDEVKANMKGWRTRTFRRLQVLQHKPTGAADGDWRNWYKNGRANYITGYHPVFMLVKCLKRIFQKPYLKAAAALFMGYVSGYSGNFKQSADKETIHYLHRQQLRRLGLQQSIYG